MATTTPTVETDRHHMNNSSQLQVLPVRIVNAGIGATNPADEMDAADEAAEDETNEHSDFGVNHQQWLTANRDLH